MFYCDVLFTFWNTEKRIRDVTMAPSTSSIPSCTCLRGWRRYGLLLETQMTNAPFVLTPSLGEKVLIQWQLLDVSSHSASDKLDAQSLSPEEKPMVLTGLKDGRRKEFAVLVENHISADDFTAQSQVPLTFSSLPTRSIWNWTFSVL